MQGAPFGRCVVRCSGNTERNCNCVAGNDYDNKHNSSADNDYDQSTDDNGYND